MYMCVFCVLFYILRSRLGETAYTDSNSKAPLSSQTTWPKRGGRTTSHFGDGVSFHGAHTHCCILLGVKRIFWRQSYRCRSGSLAEPNTEHWALSKPRIGYARSAQSGLGKRGSFIRTSEMRSGPPCALRHWQRLQPASRWRLGSYSFSADRLPTFIVCSPQDPPIPSRASRYVLFDIVSN